jgi:3-hydroxybutyryl-CoA dehydrogenase
MGSSIAVSLLIAGHPVKAIAPVPDDLESGPRRIREQLLLWNESGMLGGNVDNCLARLTVSDNYNELRNCSLVQECVIEKVEVKERIYQKIAAVTGPQTVIVSNTSAIPISTLQLLVPAPERFLGLHWAEPAYATRFLEITCGALTSPQQADWVFRLAHCWGKEPTLLRKDIRGFITNRLMYAVYREVLHLVGKGCATLEDVDKSFRYDTGSWITLMGIFRRMDFTGLKDQATIFRAYFPRLSNAGNVPPVMQRMVAENARGVHNCNGFYDYTPEEAQRWEEAFALFNRDIHRLAALYPCNPVTPANI